MARKRFKVFDYQHIIEEMRSGTSARKLERLGVASRNKIADVKGKIEALGWLDPQQPMPSAKAIEQLLVRNHVMPVVASKVEPHREKVLQMVEDGYAPKQIWRDLKKKRGFEGSLGSVKRFIHRHGGAKPKAFAVLHFEPGEAAQVDFGSGPMMIHPETGKRVRTHVFVMTLCDSRHMYAELVWDQKVRTWLRCHRNAFEFFGGVPARVIIDNLKSAITRACHKDPEVQRSYAEFARGYGFQIEPCKPRTPRLKGRVERGVGYVKSAFLAGEEFRTLDEGNQKLLEWVLGEAGNRVHGTTQEVPLRAFAEREKEALQQLPEDPPEIAVWALAKLHQNCHISFEKSYYSAPFRFVSQTLHVRATDTLVELYIEGELVAVHARTHRPGQFRTNTDHYPPEKVAYLTRTPQWCLRRAAEVGPQCHEFIEELLQKGVMRNLRGAQGVLRFGKKYGFKRLEAACKRAVLYECIQYSAVKSILEKGLDQAPDRPDDSGQLHLGFVDAPRFGRDIGQMLSGGAQ